MAQGPSYLSGRNSAVGDTRTSLPLNFSFSMRVRACAMPASSAVMTASTASHLQTRKVTLVGCSIYGHGGSHWRSTFGRGLHRAGPGPTACGKTASAGSHRQEESHPAPARHADRAGNHRLDFEGGIWVDLFAPAGTPAAIIDKLYTELAVVLKSDRLKERFANLGYDTSNIGLSPAEFGTFFRTNLAKWKRVTKDLNIRAD